MDIKLNTGSPLDRTLIPDPKHKVGDMVFCVRSYFTEVKPVVIIELKFLFDFTDNGFITHYQFYITYEVKDSIGNYEDYKEGDLFLTSQEAEDRLNWYKQEAIKSGKETRDAKITELTKDLERLIKLRDEQEQGQGTSVRTSDKKDASTVFSIGKNSPTS